MITPHPNYRLIVWSAIVLIPFGTLMGVLPGYFWIGSVIPALFVCFIGHDLLRSKNLLKGICIQLPDLIRITQDLPKSINFKVIRQSPKLSWLRIGFWVPEELISLDADLVLQISGQTDHELTFNWMVKGTKQGNYAIGKCYLETVSIFGFWDLRTSTDTQAEVRVYPNLLSDRKSLAAIFIKGHIGMHAVRQLGKGREFEQLREYMPGDSYEDIHWKATAKRGTPISKLYQIERTQRVYVIIDTSRLSARKIKTPAPATDPAQTSVETTILERFTAAALILALAANRQGDLFGLLTFNSQVGGFVPAKNGQTHFNTCRDVLYKIKPTTASPDFTELFAFINAHIRRRALIMFLTNLDEPVLAQNFIRHIDMVKKRHLVLVNIVKPYHANPLFSGDPPESVDEIYRKLGGHLIWQNLYESQKILRRKGVALAQVDSHQLGLKMVTQYLSIKQRQLL